MDNQQHTKLISWFKTFKIQWYYFAAFILFFILVIIFLTVQKRTETIVYTVSSSNKTGMQQLLQNISGKRNIITPSSIELPFSNFHEIKLEPLSNIQGRLIDKDPRDSKLLKSLIDFFYPMSETHQYTIRVISADYAANTMLVAELHKLNLDFTVAPSLKAAKIRFPGLLLLTAAIISLLLVKASNIRKRAILFMLPWLVLQCILLSESFGLLVLSAEGLLYGLLHFKPLKKTKQNFLQKKFFKYHIALIAVVLLLCIGEPRNILFGICASAASLALSIIIMKTKTKSHAAPVFAVIVPRQPFWMSRNKRIILLCSYFILVTNLIFRSAEKIVPISDAEIAEHYERQIYSTQGTLNNTQAPKPILKQNQGKISIAYEPISHQQVQYAHIFMENNIDSIFRNVSYAAGVNVYLLIALIMACLFLTIDVIITAGKKIGIMIHSNNSKKVGQQDINISVTDVIV